MEESGKKTPGVMNLDRLRPRGVKRRLTEGESEVSKRGERIRRKRQRGRSGTEEEEGEVEEEEEGEGREEMERLVGLVPSLMGREGSVSQVRNLESEFVKHCRQYGWLVNPPPSILGSASK